MLTHQGFDLWAQDYDKTVQLSEEDGSYPFAGYKQILNTVFNEVMQRKEASVLDIGFGTGVLTSRLYDHGHQIDGLDFSAKMIQIAKAKMPQAHLLKWDITDGFPGELVERKYDFIISTYALHHLTDDAKITFLKSLLPLLKEEGEIVIGDIAFSNREELEACRTKYEQEWDGDEFYFVADELQQAVPSDCTLDFHPISHCGGVFILSNGNSR